MTQVRVGEMVLYRLCEFDGVRPRAVGVYRPAVVVQVWSPECVNLQVFTDKSNDIDPVSDQPCGAAPNTFWRTSASFGDGNGQWTWMVPVTPAAEAAQPINQFVPPVGATPVGSQ